MQMNPLGDVRTVLYPPSQMVMEYLVTSAVKGMSIALEMSQDDKAYEDLVDRVAASFGHGPIGPVDGESHTKVSVQSS
eukprot:gene13697-34404_t